MRVCGPFFPQRLATLAPLSGSYCGTDLGETMTDRELLQAAAKAAGMKIHHWSTILPGPMMVDPMTDDCGGYWNPLEEDGDALRLAVKLRLDIVQFSSTVRVNAPVGDDCHEAH